MSGALVPVGDGPRGPRATSIRALVPRFLAWLRFVRERSENTVKSYRFDLATFVEFCDRGGLSRADLVRVQHVEVFMAWLRQERGLKASSANRHLHAVRTLWEWLIREELAARNPAAGVALLKLGRRLPRGLPLADQERALGPLPPGVTLAQRRTHAIVATGLLCGLRVNELSTLRLEDVDLDAGVLRVVGKGNKERECVIIPRLAAILHGYITDVRPRLLARGVDVRFYRARGSWRAYYTLRGRRVYFTAKERSDVERRLQEAIHALSPEDSPMVGRCYVFRERPWWGAYYDLHGQRHFISTHRARTREEARRRVAEALADLAVQDASPYLFVRGAPWSKKRRGQPIPTRVLYAHIHRMMTVLLGRPVHPHMLRHSFASRLREHGAGIELIQEAMGHGDIRTTMIYAHITDAKRKADVRRFLEGPPPTPPA